MTGRAGRLLGLVDLPTPKRRLLGSTPVFRPDRAAGGRQPADVVVVPDVFTAALDPVVERSAIDALTAAGYRVAVAPFRSSGKFDHVKGNRDRFAAAAKAQEALVRAITGQGATPVVVEPAVGLLHHHEYPAIRAGFPRSVRQLAEVLDQRLDRLDPSVGEGRRVSLLGHCTERATAPGVLEAWARVLAAAGYEVETPEVGCCGMAGIFGHEAANQELSRALFEATWAEPLTSSDRGAEARIAVATGFSCRSQAERFGATRPRHPAELLLHPPA